ncbi:MAG: hypothetical protein RLZZ127_970, partial [Planctomycetota bacterium]
MAPFLFQAARSARASGLLAALAEAGPAGLDADAAGAAAALPATSVTTLLEALLAGGLVAEPGPGRWCLTTTGLAWSHDPQVAVDADFTHAVCWHGLADLDESLRTARPAGLRRFGPWPTIYAGL